MFRQPASILKDLGFSSPKPSTENKYSLIISIKIPLSAFLPFRRENILVNIPHTVIGSFKSVISQKEFRIKILGFSVLFLGFSFIFFWF